MNEFLNHWFAKIKISYSKKKVLLNKYKELEQIWNARLDELQAELNDEDVEKIYISKDSNQLIKEIQILEENDIHTVNLSERLYPTKLRMIKDSPLVIYYKGNLNLCDADCAGVIGTRAPSQYGKRTSMEIATFLSNNDITVVSGMAYGIDTCAHVGALKGKSQKTIAVLGNGLLDGDVYPPSNLTLFKTIYNNGGLLISEYPIFTKASREFFPARNRIIAALSDKLIVVEAGIKSGTFITVDFALDYGKEVYAVPGGIYSEKSIGCNLLIKEGAYVICDIKDILEK